MFSVSWTTYQAILFCWIAVAIIVFFLLLRITAPYGRYNSGKWGPGVANKWGWIIMELPVLIVLWVFLYQSIGELSATSWLLISLFCFHYLNRIFIFPFRIRTRGKKIPLAIVLSAVFFNVINGWSLGYYFSHYAHHTVEWLTDGRFITGTIVFFTGLYINWRADTILINLRRPGESNYKIPNAWLFNKISCANLFGELIEWLGFAILCWNLPAVTFFIWTAANLIPRALAHHKWYKEKFSEYPLNRRAIIPYLL